jgi:hypothetical protein
VIWCEGTYLRKRKRALVVLRGARGSIAEEYEREGYVFFISVTFNLILILILTGAGAPQLCRRARTPRKRACTTLGAF